jgi:iron complex outermembrane receptor protein
MTPLDISGQASQHFCERSAASKQGRQFRSRDGTSYGRKMMIRHIRGFGRISLATAASTLALSLATPALAQEAPADDLAANDGDIVVTANRIEQNLQDVAIAVSAVSGDQLANAGVNGLDNIGDLVPSVTFRKGTTSANSAIVMRGVGTITFSVAAEPSVSTVVDGVVLSRSGQAFMDLVDIERLEVLRGPQGTLFGKNASAGLVNIISRGGSDTFEAEASAEWFEGNEYRLRGSVAGPITGNLTGRVTGFYGSYDGNIRNINPAVNSDVNGYEHYGVRAIFDLDTGPAKLRLIADYFRADDDCCAEVTGVSRGAALDGLLGIPGGNANGENQRIINHDLVTRTLDTQWSLTLSGELEVSDSHTLSLITGYRNWRNRELREGDFLPRAVTAAGQLHDNGLVTTEQLSAELRLASDADRPFFYQVGAFVWHSQNQQTFRRETTTCATTTLPPLPGGALPCDTANTVATVFGTAQSFSDVNSTNLALFGQATLRITDMLSLTAGLRWTHDDLAFTHIRAPGFNRVTGAPAVGPGVVAIPAGGLTTTNPPGNGTNISRGSVENDNISGRASIQFEPTDDLMIYASYTRGYKGPAFNVFFNHNAASNGTPIDEEISDSYEVGVRTQFLDRRVTLNGTLFQATYDGFQANNFILLGTPPVPVSNLTNAGQVRTRGFEVDLSARLFDGFAVRGSVAYADAFVRRFNPNPATNAPSALNGTQLPLAPEWSWNVGADYERDLGGFVVYASTSYAYTGDQFSELGNVGPIDSYGIWNASLGFSDSEDRYRVTFIARNIGDTSYVLLNTSAGQRLHIPRDADRYFGVGVRVRIR